MRTQRAVDEELVEEREEKIGEVDDRFDEHVVVGDVLEGRAEEHGYVDQIREDAETGERHGQVVGPAETVR